MKKYKVEFTQTETFIVDVKARNKAQAEITATKEFESGNFQETGDCAVSLSCVYDVTNTDDPFDENTTTD